MGTLIIISIAALALGIFYVVGFWSTKTAGRVELILFIIANLKPQKKHVLKMPKKIVALIKILIYKRNLFINKLEARQRLK
ncbi:MAG TPA: hypothetical protein VFD16_01610 [Candidatus Saccharimonadales bacterium]|nr:hypothetical protein [Candidatus Saccharimonadales bacterium]